MEQKNLTRMIIDKWPSRRALAEDVSRETGKELQPVAVARWHKRKSIPSKYDRAIVVSAEKRAISVSLVDLMNARAVHVDQLGNSVIGDQGQQPEKVERGAA